MATSGLPRRLIAWVREHRIILLFLLLMAAMLPARSLWAPDEPDFAQCVREMRERGSWLLPYLNGHPYSEKPILFYWLTKSFNMAGDWLARGRGFDHGIAPWALRLPSVLSALFFALGYRRWIKRFHGPSGTEMSCLILLTTPIWVWQAQTIQTDMVFTTLLAWSWLAWLGGYLIVSGETPGRSGQESRLWFLEAYLALGLAVLAKGPLALVLSLLVAATFLTWEKAWWALAKIRMGMGMALVAAVVLPWLLAATWKGGAVYAYQMVIHQNFERATSAWDHVQPWWRYAKYLAGDFWPWCLLLPALGLNLIKTRKHLSSANRFQVVAFLVPLIFLSMVQSKQGKYLLMVYPFLALLIPTLGPSPREARERQEPLGWPAWVLAAGLWLPSLGLAALAFTPAGGAKVHALFAPFLDLLRGMAVIALGGALVVTLRARQGRLLPLFRATSLTLGLLYLVTAVWGLPRLDQSKGYLPWTRAVTPLIQGRKVYFWQTIRSGAMVYTDHQMPEIRSAQELDAVLGLEDRLVSQEREWVANDWGMNAKERSRFEILLRIRTGENALLLLRRKP